MLVSGLWKLAAMTGVISVGLVAVYQAKQGIDHPPTTASADAETALGDEIDSESGADPNSPPPGAAPENPGDLLSELEGADPFGNASTASSARKPAAPTPDADESADERGPTPLAETDSAPAPQTSRLLPDDVEQIEQQLLETRAPKRQSLPDETADERITEAAVPVRSVAPGLPTLAVPDATPEPIRQVSATDEESPASLDDPDPFGTPEPKPVPAPAATPDSLDEPITPFGVEEKPETPVKPVPTTLDESSTPLASGEDEQPEPFKPNAPSTADPLDLGDSPAENERTPDPLMEESPSTGTDMPEDAADQLQESADPFGNAAPEPKRKATPPVSAPDTELGSPFTEEPPARDVPLPGGDSDEFPGASPRPLPRLPTVVPDEMPADEPGLGFPGDSAFPDTPRPVPTREPALQLDPDPQPERMPAGSPASRPGPKPVSPDLIGDGTIPDGAIRGLKQARVTVEKVAPQQATLGEPMVYSIFIKNIGTIDAQQVTLEDRIPKGTELSGTAPRAELIERKLTWKLGTLKAGEERKISIRVIPRQQGQVGSVATVSFATEVVAETEVAAPELIMTAKAPRQVRVGETFDLMFLLKNTGPVAASNVSVRDLVPAGLKHEAASDIECPIGKLAPNESREVVLTVTAVKPGRVSNRAILTGEGGIHQEIESPIEVIGEQLVLSRTGQNRVYVDRPAQFANNVRNEGNEEVQNIRLSEVVPAGMEFVDATDGGRYDAAQRAIYWDIGTIPPGAEATVSSRLIARAPGVQQAQVTATGPSGSTARIKSDVDVVGRPELQIETVGRTGTIVVGDRLTSRIQLKNHGSASARNVGLIIRLPRELKLIEVQGGQYRIQNQLLTFEPVTAISPQETVAVELVMEAVAEADAQMNLEITADHLSKPARRIDTIQIASEIR